jgi:hypothetical protein
MDRHSPFLLIHQFSYPNVKPIESFALSISSVDLIGHKEPARGLERTALALTHPIALIFLPLSASFPALNEVIKISTRNTIFAANV